MRQKKADSLKLFLTMTISMIGKERRDRRRRQEDVEVARHCAKCVRTQHIQITFDVDFIETFFYCYRFERRFMIRFKRREKNKVFKIKTNPNIETATNLFRSP